MLPDRLIFDTTLSFGIPPTASDLVPLSLEALQTGRPAVAPALVKDARAGEETFATALPTSLSIDHAESGRYAARIRYRANS